MNHFYKNNFILQWNSIICFQEIHFKDDFCADIKGYKAYHKNRITDHASGGVVIYVKENIFL